MCSPRWGLNRDRALLAVTISSAARAAEVLGLRGVDIDWSEQLGAPEGHPSCEMAACRARKRSYGFVSIWPILGSSPVLTNRCGGRCVGETTAMAFGDNR